MLRNFLKTAGRIIVKQRAYTAINLIGLTTGIALALLIMAYVRSEINYDTFHEKIDRLYRINYKAPNGLDLASSPPPIAPAMKDFFPEVEQTARLYGRNVSIKLPEQDVAFEETGVFFADSTIMEMFSFEFVKGNPARALVDKFTIIINEEMATKYFGEANPIGESLLFSGQYSFKVTGVVKNFPENSHLRFNMLVPYENMFDLESDQTAQVLRNNLAVNFVISHGYTYVLLKKGADPHQVDTGMEAFLKKHALPQMLVGQVFTLFPVKDIHLKSTSLAEPSTTNSMSTIYIFIAIGLLTLIIASINYINLSTAQSLTRIKEIGVRVIMGSGKQQIVLQFFVESFLFVLISMILAFGVFHTALPLLNLFTGKHLVFTDFIDFTLAITCLSLLIGLTLLAGAYPAYFVTKFNSVASLKGEGVTGLGSQWLRKSLVVFQLSIAFLLLSCSMLIVKQLRYLHDRPLGFEKENVVTIPLFSQNLNGIFGQRDSLFAMRLQSFRDALESETGILKTTLSSNPPGLGATYRGTVPDGFTQEDRLFVANFSVDYDFNETYGLRVIEGRWFSQDYGTDVTEAFVVNEAAVKEFNWGTPAEAIGKTINREGKLGKVIGVIKDYNFTSLTTPVSGLVIEHNKNQFNTLSVRFENNEVTSLMEKVEAQWNKSFPEKSFEYVFLDEQLDLQYASYQSFGDIIRVFTMIAILISCLGVYGLVLFIVQRKVKEIGVRKVLGSSVASILFMIFKDFMWLLLFGFLLAVPVSYYFLNNWLQNFTYHTNLDLPTFIISFLVLLGITLLTVSYQAIKASLANPIRSLRSE